MHHYGSKSLTLTRRPVVLFLAIIGLWAATMGFGQTASKSYIGINPSFHYDPRVPIFDEKRFDGMTMDGTRSPLYHPKLSSVKREVKIDSTGQNINFVEKIGEFDFRLPTYMTLAEYVHTRRIQDLRENWTQTMTSRLSERRVGGSGGGALRIDIPVEIKSKAFQRIFGSGNVGLDVTGDITIRGGFRNEKRSEVKTALTRGSDNSFKMEQTQRFQVKGHIGEKVTIGVDQDSERPFDFDNNIQLKYEGYEDEIIQSIEAGNIALSLPGTRYVTFGGKSSGLFGIKAAATLGNLKLTGIMSQEKGEKKKMSFKGGASEEAKRVEDYQYKKGTYYFIDNYYRDKYLVRDTDGNFLYDPFRVITDIELYKSAPNYQQRYSESIRGWAWVPKSDDLIITQGDTSTVDPEHYRGYFLRLEKNEYFIRPELGYIRLDSPLGEGEVLAIAYRDSTGRVRGMIDFNPNTQKTIQLKLLKTQNPRPSDKTWDLEWKNVYSLGGRNVPQEGFELRIFFKPPSGDPQETITLPDGKKITYLQLFGLDRVNRAGESKPDNVIDDNPNIINFAMGELMFPDLQPFDPVSEGFQNLLPQEKRVQAIYDTTVQSVINAQSNFYIEINSKTRSTEYRLGFNIIENSEEVTLNGRRLTRGTEYTIDYYTGTIRILDEQASAANANLDITYESNQLFQIDKKTIMGARAEYGLWGDSFIGATFLYLNERTLEQKVRVGKGPMRNMVWDVNTSLSAEPYFLTRFANLLPFVDTRAPSSIRFEGEIAQILPNPNTRNNENTGDNDGVAYIDDFEAAKRITQIGIVRRGWNYASPPVFPQKLPVNQVMARRGDLIFFNPYGQYPIRQIWPNRDLNANVAQTVNIMMMRFEPVDSVAAVQESWNGIMTSLSPGYYNQTESKFLEVWVRGTEGVMHIDLGQISEDVIPNQKLDTEDRLSNGIRNGILDPGEDVGMDGMSDKDPRAIAAGGDFWDLNGNGKRDWGEPYSHDNWVYNPSNSYDPDDYAKVNGTEGNENDGGGRRPDSEDLNGNGDVDLRNDYFSYSFSLRRDHPDTLYISGASISTETGEDFGWRQYRIPLQNLPSSNFKRVGSPDLSLIEYIRIWVDGFDAKGKKDIWLAEVNLVGSEWKELGVAPPENPEKYEAADDSTVTVTVVNTHDNPTYKAPPGVQGEVDRVTQVIQREQALVLKVHDLQPGYNGIIQKTFYEAQDYINYNTMKMFVYGHDPYGRHITKDSTTVEIFLRFGSDLNNYYEIRQPVYEGWSKNNVEIDLVQLTQIKFTSTDVDSITRIIRKVHKDGRVWLVKGSPALRNIRMLTAGVKNKGYADLGTSEALFPFTGEIYINELRLSNVKKDKGMAYRARLDMAWADLIRFNGEIEKIDADFHNVATRFGDGDDRISANFNTSISVEKFLPSKLGISIPVSFNYAKSEATPKYKPGTDVQVKNSEGNYALPDSIIKQIQTVNKKRGMSVSFSVTSRSQNFFIKNLLSRLRASYSRNEGTGSDSRTEFSKNLSESANLDWGINFARDNYLKPFSWLGNSSLLTNLANTKLYFTPQNITTRMSGTRSSSESRTRTGVPSENSSFNVNQNYAMQLNVFESLNLDVNRGYTNDLNNIPNDTLMMQLKQGRLGLLTGVNQNFSVRYNPKIFSWLTNNVNYSTGFKYGYNRQQTLQSKSASRDRNLTLSGALNLGTLGKSIYRPGTRPGAPRGASPRPRPAPGQQIEDPEQKNDEKKGFTFSPMKYFVGLLNVFEPFSVNYSWRDNLAAYGLDGVPTLPFQFGLTDTMGVGLEMVGGGGSSSGASLNRGSSSTSESRSASSGLNISRSVRLSFKYDDSYSLNSSTTTTGQRSKSWLKYEQVNTLFPNWTLRVDGLEKLPFVKNYIQRMSLEHGYNGRASETFNVEKGRELTTKEDIDSQFRPLVGMNLSWKNGISMTVRYNMSERITLSKGFGIGSTKTTTSDLSITANYSKSGDFRIPLPFLNKRLKNSIDISFTFNMSDNTTFKSRGGGGFEITGETAKWFVKPDVKYSFSDRVRGGAYFEVGKTHNKLIGDSSYKELGIDVNISIRGS